MMRRTLKKIQTVYVKDLLYGLQERHMGTPDVINHANKMLERTRCGDNRVERLRQPRDSRRNGIVRLAMKSKIKDAWECLRKEKREEQRMWRQLRPKLRERGKVNEYNDIWATEKDRYFTEM